ncbi:uncharacterized protein [Typha latifolia]|uniref:uncharacterized protein n=1 Tax=Typha latifolia TaxID=4733 RepID=UPI003C2ED399
MAAEPSTAAAEEAAARAVHKRYEALTTVRTKAIKGKGAWYWSHLEPILVQNSETGLPKAVKLRCSLCDAIFSASNPSRTASEHLKRGTCPNFSSPPKPISSIAPCSSSRPNLGRKRSSHLALIDPSQPTQALVLSGGKDDLGALAMLRDSVKKLKSPKTSPGPPLSRTQIDSSLALLSDWFYESFGAVSLSSIEHPKLRAFLHQVGLPPLSRSDLVGPRLDARFDAARADVDARVHEALFFQLASDGWRPNSSSSSSSLVALSLNLPNGTSVFHSALPLHAPAMSDYADDVLWNAIIDVCGNGSLHRCAGIVADRFKSKALRSIEDKHHWMVNLSCQVQSFHNLVKDFHRELSLFHNVSSSCSKIANYFNSNSQVRKTFHKYQLQEVDHTSLLRVADADTPVFAMLEDILASAQAIQLVNLDESYKILCLEDPIGRELGEMIRDMGFWNNVEAVHSLVKLINGMAQEMEVERPLVGQCLPLWEELRSKVKDCCAKFNIEDTPVEKVIDKRFKKNYHPAWSAAFVLDPLYLVKDASGRYLPPFKCLTPEQEKDVDKLITRMVSREEAHIALMELMKWRSEGMDPLYAQAVQVKQLDPTTGKMRIANPQSSRLVWETCLSEFKSLGKVAVRLIFLHATACGVKYCTPVMRWLSTPGRSGASIERVNKLLFITAHSKLERRDFSNEEDKDADLFADEEDNVLNESPFMEPSSV